MSTVRLKYFFLILSFVFLILFLREMDIKLFISQFNQIGIGFIPIILSSLIAYLFASIAWQLCYSNSYEILTWKKLRDFFLIRQMGESLATFNPTGVIAGDALKYYMMRKQNCEKKITVLSLSLIRILTLISFAILVLFTVTLMVFISEQLSSPLFSVLVAFLLLAMMIALGYLFFSKRLIMYSIFIKLIGEPRSKKMFKLSRKIKAFNIACARVQKIKGSIVLSAFFLLLLHYILGAVEFMIILHYLGYSISMNDAVILEIGTSFVRSIMSFIPGQIGVDEYSNKLFLELIGVNDKGVWITVSIVRRMRQIFWIVIAIIAFYSYSRKKIQSSRSEAEQIIIDGAFVHQS